MSNLIRYKGIIHERAEDAPFMGALIIATSCSNGCQGCFNQHLKDAKTYVRCVDDVIREVRNNPFNDGIILGGLEWSEQPEEATMLIRSAMRSNLQVMLYTGLTESDLYSRIPFNELVGCYVKFGKYDSKLASNTYTSYGVKLASTNQYIKFINSPGSN